MGDDVTGDNQDHAQGDHTQQSQDYLQLRLGDGQQRFPSLGVLQLGLDLSLGHGCCPAGEDGQEEHATQQDDIEEAAENISALAIGDGPIAAVDRCNVIFFVLFVHLNIFSVCYEY